MGRKALVSSELIQKELLKHTVHDDSMKLKGKNQKVWKDISEALQSKIKPESLYLMVKINRKDLRDVYEKEKKIVILNTYELNDCDEVLVEAQSQDHVNEKKLVSVNKSDKFIEKAKDCSISVIDKTENLIDDVLKSDGVMEFCIEVNIDEWNSIKPVIKTVGAEARIMQTGWADILFEKVWEKIKIPCAIDFENHYIGKSCFFSTEGHCSEYKSTLSIKLINDPTSAPVHFEVMAQNVKLKIPHSGCRRLAGPKRESVKKQLLNQLPKNWQRKEAEKIMNHNDVNPPHLYKLASLQKARRDAINDDLGIQSSLTLFESYHQLKANSTNYGHFIREIGFDSFFVFFWSQEQIDMHNDVIEYLDNPSSADATGSICISIKNPGLKVRHNFLTILTTHVEHKIVVTCQMLSERNDSNIICYWLREFLRSGARIPPRMVTDMGRGLRIGICLAFNNVTLEQYNNICLCLIKNVIEHHNLKTQMLTDIAHFVHLCTRWPNFSNKEDHVKRLYKHCIGVMSTIEELKDFEEFFKSIVVLSYSIRSNSECNKAFRYIINLIKTFEFQDSTKVKLEEFAKNEVEEDKMVQNMTNFDFDDESKIEIGAEEEIEQIIMNLTKQYEDFDEIENETTKDKDIKDEKKKFESVKDYIHRLIISIGLENLTDNEFLQANEYYYPEFGKRFIELCYEFPCCTNTTSKIFGMKEKVATSARCENRMRDVKDTILENRIPIRQDKFVIKYCKQIDSDLKLSRSELNRVILQKKKKFTTNKANKKRNQEHDTQYLKESDRWENHGKAEIKDDKLELPKVLKSDNFILRNLEFSNQQELILPLSDDVIAINQPIATSSPKNINQKLNIEPYPENIEAKKLLPQPNKRKRGFYVSPNPSIELDLQLPKRSRKEVHVIQNGCKKGGKKSISGKPYSFYNTCAWDSITEIISYGSKISSLYKNFIDTNKSKELAIDYKCYFTTISTYINTGLTNSNSIYTSRAYQLLPIAQRLKQIDSINGVNCTCNPNNLFQTQMEQYDCTQEFQDCKSCNFHNVVKKPVTPLPNTNIVKVSNYSTLEVNLETYFSEHLFNCQNCTKPSGKSLTCTYALGPYIWLDVEDAYKSIDENCENSSRIVTNLANIPVTLTIHSQNFILCGAVEARPGHFVAHCYNAQYKYWEEKNDLNECAIRHKQELPSVQLNSILYVKWQSFI